MSDEASNFGLGEGEEWRSLHRSQLDLRVALDNAESEDERVELLRRLRDTRAAISDMEGQDPEHESVTEAVGEPTLFTNGSANGSTSNATANATVIESGGKRRRSIFLVALGGLILLFGGAALGYGFGAAQVDDETSSSAASTPSDEAAQVVTSAPADNVGATTTTAAATTTTAAEAEEAEGGVEGRADAIVVTNPIAALSFSDYQFSVEGVVADPELADGIGAAVEKTYGEYGSSAISADAAVPVEPWTDRLMYVVKNFPRLIDGSLLIGADGVVLTGRAPNEEAFDYFVDELSPENGFPPLDMSGLEVVDLVPPSLDIQAMNGVLTLQGTVPSEEMRERIVRRGIDLYGEDNIINSIEIDEERFPLFDVARFPQVVSVFSVGGNFEVKMVEGGFFGVLEHGLNFEAGSSDLTTMGQQTLSGFPALIARTTVDITIIGHTDSDGSDERNVRLSEARAQAVATQLESLGVDAARLIVVGQGESQPVASNSSADGRAKNRRVVITMGFEDD